MPAVRRWITKRTFLALCAALALVVLPRFSTAATHPVSGERAPSIGAQRRPQAALTSPVSHRRELLLASCKSSLTAFYGVCLLLGFATGYWAVFVTMASELFGTNTRATVTTTAPNFVRGAVVALTFGFKQLKEPLGVVGSAIAVGVVTLVIAVVSLVLLEETFGKNLDHVEE